MHHRPLTAAVVGVFLFLSPVLSHAATAFTFTTPSAQTVTRGDFLKAAVTALKIEFEKGKRSMPYGRLPSDVQPYVQVAHGRGALGVFGTDLKLNQGIKRGEAMQVLAGLTDDEMNAPVKAFSDVKAGTPVEKAVSYAIRKNWILPVSNNLFGVDRPLLGKEAKLVMQRVQRSLPKTPSRDTLPVIRIDVGRKDRAVPKSDVMQAVWNIINDDYLYKDRISAEKAATKALEGLVQSLNDPYSTYLPAALSRNFQDQLRGELEGIGATVEQVEGVVLIVAPLKGSPAEKAGLQPKDEILSAAEKGGPAVPFKGLTLDEAVSKIRGAKGTDVTLRIRREGYELDVTVRRDTVTIPEVEITMQQSVAVVKLHQFGEATDKKLRAKMIEVQEMKPKGIVLDLRNNPGGLLHAAGVVVGYFLPKDSVFATIVSKDDTVEERTVDEPVISPTIPVVVLINAGSASASEIVAGALQDAKRATLIGEKTFGKGTVQQVVQFSDGSSLKLTVAEWLTPSGRKIDKLGIKPDKPVSTETGSRDEALVMALEMLR